MVSIDKLESVLEEDNIIFLTYGGVFTQSLIVGMTGVLEKEVEEAELSMKTSNNIFVVFIELAQNVMNYSKSIRHKKTLNPKALIYVGKLDKNYFVCSQNIVSKEDKEKMEPMLEKIVNATKDDIKKLYRDVRRNGKATHEKGAGLGFLEVAKKAQKIEYSFTDLQNGKYYYKICTTL